MRALAPLTPALLAALSFLTAACGRTEAGPPRRPDIVFIVVDTLRRDFGGARDLPGFQRLAREGVPFRNAFSHAPMTLPAHAALFSSRAPFETGVLNNHQDVPGSLPLLPEWLSEHGYQTHAVVSLGTLDPRGKPALDRGFDSFDQDYWHMDKASDAFGRLKMALDAAAREQPLFLFAHFSDPHAPYNRRWGVPSTAELLLDGEPLATVVTSDMTMREMDLPLDAGEHLLEFRSEVPFRIRAFEWTRDGKWLKPDWEAGDKAKNTRYVRISTRTDQPIRTKLRFWIAEAPRGLDEIRARYRHEVEWVDRYVGRLIEELEERGLWDDAIVVFTSDHGEALGEGRVVGHTQNLRDEMLHVPLLIKPPAGSPYSAQLRRRSGELVVHQDVVPTVLDMAGLPPLPGARGNSLLEEQPSLLVAQTHKPEAKRNLIGLRDERYKMVYDPDSETFEMYDVLTDREEQRDVFAEQWDQRADWVDSLRSIADLTASGASEGGATVDEETRAMLSALGYAAQE